MQNGLSILHCQDEKKRITRYTESISWKSILTFSFKMKIKDTNKKALKEFKDKYIYNFMCLSCIVKMNFLCIDR